MANKKHFGLAGWKNENFPFPAQGLLGDSPFDYTNLDSQRKSTLNLAGRDIIAIILSIINQFIPINAK